MGETGPNRPQDMTYLLDTNVLIYASQPDSPFHAWATSTIAEGVVGDGAATNAVSIAEVCVGDRQPESADGRIRSRGVQIVDLPAGRRPHALPPIGGTACGAASRPELSHLWSRCRTSSSARTLSTPDGPWPPATRIAFAPIFPMSFS